jgi:cytochrome c oxidase assembly protein subunit 15
MTLLLLIVGALVTSHQAGLSVPDWPTSFGSLYRMPPMVGNVKFEHGHRMVAEFVGFLTVILAIWSWRAESRNWMRWLGVVAVLTVIAQGVLGGLTVKMFLPWYISTAHAALAQTFFCLVVLMALFSSRTWVETASAPLHDVHVPSLYTLTLFSLAALYVQLFFGAAFRHNGMPFAPHLINAGVVTILLLGTSLRAMTSKIPALRAPGLWVHGLLMLQVALGFAAYFTRVRWGADAPQPLPSMVASTVAHVGVGALLLGATFILLFQTRRHLVRSPQKSGEQSSAHREAAA